MTREEAIAILEVSKHMATSGRLYNQAIDMAIEALQREEAEEKGYCHRIKPKEYFSTDAEWIPCSERLPSESDDYLCTIPLDANETYTEVLTFHKGRFYEDDDEWGATYHDDVIAWMPLPKPYKGGGDK